MEEKNKKQGNPESGYEIGNAVLSGGTVILPITKIWVNLESRQGVTTLRGGLNIDLLETGNVLMTVKEKDNIPKDIEVITLDELNSLLSDIVASFEDAYQSIIEIDNINQENQENNKGEF